MFGLFLLPAGYKKAGAKKASAFWGRMLETIYGIIILK